mmetsp:Transcript_37755/g.70735  ORF Transcript_37755/g.70735 Transcript_37755/m.70735 type:complete len:177 (-) Transcript_37755:78-608(-)
MAPPEQDDAAATQEKVTDWRVMVGLTVSGVFVLICVLVGFIHSCKKLAKVRAKRAKRKFRQSLEPQASIDEQEREEILAEVYGRSAAEDGLDDEHIDASNKDETDLNKAWKAIQRAAAASSDEEDDFDQFGVNLADIPSLYPVDRDGKYDMKAESPQTGRGTGPGLPDEEEDFLRV